MKPKQIADRAELEDALSVDRFLLFKHSLVCPISSWAFSQYLEFAKLNPEVPTGWIEVRDQRPLSDLIADAAGVEHESPQAIYLESGRAVWNASHNALTVDALEDGVGV